MIDKERRLQIADEASRMLESPVFDAVLNTMLKDHIQTLMEVPVGSDKAREAHIGMKHLEAIKGKLRALANDGVMIRSQEPKAGSEGG